MIRSFTIVNHLGESLFIDIRKPEATGFLITSVDGLGPVKAEISQSSTGSYDGAIISGSRLEPRNIVINIMFFRDNTEKLSIEDIRHKSYVYFPVKREIEILVENDHGTFKIKGTVESNEIPIFTKEEGTQVSIICDDPFFEKEGDGSTKYVSRVIPNFSFPVSFEAEMVDVPDEEYQPEAGLDKIVDQYGNVYYRYAGPFSAVSKAFDTQIIGTKRRFMDSDITVEQIPYVEEPNGSDGLTVKIGGDPSGNS